MLRGYAVPQRSSGFARGAANLASASCTGARSRAFSRSCVSVRASEPRWFDEREWMPHVGQKPEQVVTFITSDGLVTLSDSLHIGLAAPEAHHDFAKPRELLRPLPSVEEQGVCIGQTFLVAASNGRDLTRRVHVLGFCRSIDLLSETIEDTVLSHGGAVYQRDTQPSGGLEERLIMTIALPMLWGLPPAFDSLRTAITHGGGIVHKVSKHWQLL